MNCLSTKIGWAYASYAPLGSGPFQDDAHFVISILYTHTMPLHAPLEKGERVIYIAVQDFPSKSFLVSGVIILIVVIILIYIKCVRRHGNEETPGRPQNSVRYTRPRDSFEDDTQLISEPPYIVMAESPPVPAPRPKAWPVKSLKQLSTRRTSQKQNASSRKKSNTSALESLYTVILPLGQGIKHVYFL